jgi:hypothetical protein
VIEEGVRSCWGLETKLGFLGLELDMRRAMVSSSSITWSVFRNPPGPPRPLDEVDAS